MALTNTETQITWSSAAFLLVSSATPVVSDAFAIDPTTVAASIQVYASNGGTPASGDTAVWQISYTVGDILGDTGDDYGTTEHSAWLAVLDTYPTNTPGENPAAKTVPINIGVKGGKLVCTCANAASRNITIRARLIEKRSA